MIDQQMAATLLSVLTGIVVLATYMRTIKRDLERTLTSQIAAAIGPLSEKVDSVHSGLSEKVDSVHSGLNDKIDSVHSGLNDKIDILRADVLDVRATVRVLEQRTFEMVHHSVGAMTADGGTASS